ncbi:hypothetical protein CONPUDRAFT_124600 [Coniophora puteana RWD-64-598 SS2]|uniref:Uncharacterized protein n=1 Tax=Coniophora puteana (strain RWD-64-598) TaxID=741705 RepID=A0A5M3MQK8_CONPW|nr:uncharacterized protein CONPUDRAFT_124600 [Coniophora puteana RWD-64-598 SS2]EIW81472.1 hypothetical protein CONPUDRAFT_124600 [Coniophora puteana RWD-64-598 SS2]
MPKGPEAYRRLKYLYPVYDHKLGDKWEDVCPRVRGLLDKQQVRFSTIDLVRFRTVPDQQTPASITPVVIWVGVLPDSLAVEDASNSANAILALLNDEGITAVDIEFRESVFRRSAGVELYEPASDLDAIRHVIDPLTTALGLPIASAKTPHLQGTMGFYFKDGDDLYGVTARHVLFPTDEDNSDYTYNPRGPRKEVLLMGTKAWDDYLKSVQIQIGVLGTAAEIHERSIGRLEGRVAGDDPAAEKAKKELTKTRELLKETTDAIDELQELYEQTKKDFGKPSQRVIGHVVWSPGITVGTGPHGFAKDVCVVKLDKAKFLPNFKGNVIDLGTEIEAAKFQNKMNPRKDAPFGFKYPDERLLELRGILAEDRMRHPDMKDHEGENCLFVIKHGLTTRTTIGRASRFFSYAREYFSNQTHRDSIEWAILPYDNGSGAFSKGGDSGSMIASGSGEFGGLITGGSGKTESSDITYATPMFWLWLIIKAKFPNANLYPVFN